MRGCEDARPALSQGCNNRKDESKMYVKVPTLENVASFDLIDERIREFDIHVGFCKLAGDRHSSLVSFCLAATV